MLADRLPHCIVYGVSCKSPRKVCSFFLPSDPERGAEISTAGSSNIRPKYRTFEKLDPALGAADRTAVRTFGELPVGQLFSGKLAIGRDSRHRRLWPKVDTTKKFKTSRCARLSAP